jgi:hypothetical protein
MRVIHATWSHAAGNPPTASVEVALQAWEWSLLKEAAYQRLAARDADHGSEAPIPPTIVYNSMLVLLEEVIEGKKRFEVRLLDVDDLAPHLGEENA